LFGLFVQEGVYGAIFLLNHPFELVALGGRSGNKLHQFLLQGHQGWFLSIFGLNEAEVIPIPNLHDLLANIAHEILEIILQLPGEQPDHGEGDFILVEQLLDRTTQDVETFLQLQVGARLADIDLLIVPDTEVLVVRGEGTALVAAGGPVVVLGEQGL
jgi:hypothetical protein